MPKLILLISIFLCFMACQNQQENKNFDDPLTVVIKLISAEDYLEFEEAKKYIEIDSVYSKLLPEISEDSLEIIWKQLKTISYDMKNDPKFKTRGMKYYDYKIEQIKTLSSYQVIFTDNQGINPYQKIIYELQPINNKLKIVKIKHIKF